MARLKPGPFNEFELSTEEEENGRILNEFNIMHIHNLRSAKMNEKCLMKLDTTKVQEYVQSEAFLQGQLWILDMLLTDSERAVADRAVLNPVEPQA